MALTVLSFALGQWADIATILASIVAGLALLYAALQIRISTKVSRAGFWLELRKMFAEHKDLHLKLRKKEWPDKEGSCPGEEEDWPALEAYMGLFEHCEAMLGQGLIDWPTFKAIYGYRVENIIRNPWIVREKLIRRRYGWKKFLHLVEKMKDDLPRAASIWLRYGQ